MMRILLAILFSICSFIAKGEVWPYYSTVDLCLKADLIVDAKYHSSTKDNCKFTYRDLEKPKSKIDTFGFYDISHTIEFVNDEIYEKSYEARLESFKLWGIEEAVTFRNADRIIFFLIQTDNDELHPILGGYRIVKDNQVYYPTRRTNPGPYSFSLPGSLDAKTFSEDLSKTIRRTSKFKTIFRTKPIEAQKKYYRKWLKNNSDELIKELPRSLSNNGAWGMLHWLYRGHQKPSDISFENFKSFLIQNSIIKKE